MKHSLTQSSFVSLPDDVMVATLGTEAVLMNRESGTYFGLNEVGASILSKVSDPRSVADVVTAMLDEYDVQRADLERDILAFLQQMADHDLIEVKHEVAL